MTYRLDDILPRVEERLKALGVSASAASKEAGLGEDAIRNWRRAMREGRGATTGVNLKSIAALAPVLDTTTQWLLLPTVETESGLSDRSRHFNPPPPRPTTDSVAIVGFVGAGSVATLYSEGQGPFDHVEAPANSTPKTVGLKIQGTSLGPAFDRGLVFYDDIRSPVTPDLLGRLCVVGLADGRVLVKILKDAGNGMFHLLSNTVEEPLLNELVDWAARVRDVRPY